MPFAEAGKMGRSRLEEVAGEPARESKVPFLYMFKMDIRNNCPGPIDY